MPVTVDLPLVPATPMLRGATLNSCARSSARRHDVWDGILDGRRDHHCLVCARHSRTILRKQCNAAALEELELRCCASLIERPVRAGNLRAVPAQNQRQRQHPAAADAAKEVRFVQNHSVKL
jgi:hypothetical protein